MSFLEDTRSKEDHTGEPNEYYEELLDKDGKDWLIGYDTAMDEVKHFFYNLEVYQNSFLLSGFNPFDVDYSVIEPGRMLEKFTFEERNQMTGETKIALAFYNAIEDWMESARNISVTAKIDMMDRETYKRNLKKIYGAECED